MKPFIIACLLFITLGANAQSNVVHPFPTDSAAWYDYSSIEEDDFWPFYNCDTKYYLNGTDTVNGIVYHKVYATSKCYCVEVFFQYPCGSSAPNFTPDYFTGTLLRTDSNKVYAKRDTAPEFVLYDYNILLGDTFRAKNDSWIAPYVDFICVAIDSAITNTGYRKQWNFTEIPAEGWGCSLDTLKWIEGATSNLGLFYNKVLIECNTTGVVSYGNTNCFIHRDALVLGNNLPACEYLVNSITDNPTQANISLFPNPTTADFTVKTNASTQNLTLQLYNSLGQQVASYSAASNQLTIPRNGLPNGVYIAQIQSGRGVARQKVLFTN